MSDTALESGTGMSLADIAGMDVTDVTELRASSLPAGLYTFEGISGTLEEREKDGEKRYGAQMKFKVLEATAILDRDVNPSDLVGKTHTEFRQIDPADAATGIGYLKGFVADIGLDSSGALGGVEDAPPGMLDRIEGHRFEAKIRRSKGKDGVERSNIDPIKKKG